MYSCFRIGQACLYLNVCILQYKTNNSNHYYCYYQHCFACISSVIQLKSLNFAIKNYFCQTTKIITKCLYIQHEESPIESIDTMEHWALKFVCVHMEKLGEIMVHDHTNKPQISNYYLMLLLVYPVLVPKLERGVGKNLPSYALSFKANCLNISIHLSIRDSGRV